MVGSSVLDTAEVGSVMWTTADHAEKEILSAKAFACLNIHSSFTIVASPLTPQVFGQAPRLPEEGSHSGEAQVREHCVLTNVGFQAP